MYMVGSKEQVQQALEHDLDTGVAGQRSLPPTRQGAHPSDGKASATVRHKAGRYIIIVHTCTVRCFYRTAAAS